MTEGVMEIGVSVRNPPLSGYSPLSMFVDHAAISQGVLVLHGLAAPWVMDAAKKLEAIGRLPAGWDSYGGAALDADAKKLTVSALSWLGGNDLPVPAVVLASAGTVQLEWRADGRELEVELGKDGIEFLKVHPTGSVEGGEEKANLPERLQGLTWWLLHG